jgi:hypothetical protein
MARARNIKPGFFVNEELAELPFETRLLFIGLWTLADRDGRLEDRPKRIKMALFPADEVDTNGMLEQLHKAGFICRYVARGIKCIQVVNFEKHQTPHVREAASELPKIGETDAEHNLGSAEHNLGNGEASPRSPDSPFLIPDSLIPESPLLIPESVEKREVADASVADATPDCPHTEILALYHSLCPTLPRIRDWTDGRRKALRSLWRDKPERQRIEFWHEFFGAVSRTPFLLGVNDRNWIADIDWLLKPANFQKVLEGRYESRGLERFSKTTQSNIRAVEGFVNAINGR